MTRLNPDGDTRLGGPGREFPSTCWSRLLEEAPKDAAGRRAGVEELALRYWKPIYVFIRVRWAKSNEDAKDLAQDFFSWMLEGGFLDRVDPSRGRFRTFVKVALRNWLVKESDKSGRLKRGGGRVEALDEILRNGGDVPLSGALSPEEALDEAWRDELLQQTVRRLEEEYRREGKESWFLVFRDHHFSRNPTTDYKALAERHGVRETDVSNYLVHVKRRLREVLTEQISQTVQGEEDLRAEMKALFGGGGP